MHRWLLSSALACVVAAPLYAEEITGKYVEARTCDVFTGPCFANADTSLTGKHAVMAWKVEKGDMDNVSLEGLSVVAVIQARETLGQEQTSAGKALLIVDQKATAAQRAALIQLAQRQAGDLVKNVIAVHTAAVDLTLCECKDGSCAILDAGVAKVQTRCLDKHHDRGCGNEYAYYPPLARGVKAQTAMATQHVFTGKDFNETWKESERRGAYVGTFSAR